MKKNGGYKKNHWISKTMKAELLDAETELELARRWHYHECEKSLHRLVNAYMRLAISMASKYSRYGVDRGELIQEASIGLMKASKKFDPERGVRFSTYATWWIKASLQEFILRNWSLVRTASTATQKLLFFNFKRVKSKLECESGKNAASVDHGSLNEIIAEQMGVPLRDVEMMETRLAGGDFSLNSLQQNEEGREWIETIEDEDAFGSEKVNRENDDQKVRLWIQEALNTLNIREKRIVVDRKLMEKPRTLHSLGVELGVSKERVRQLEGEALKKLKKYLEISKGIYSMAGL